MSLNREALLNSVPSIANMPTSGISPRESFILSRIDGRMRLRDIVKISGMNENEALAMVEILHVRGILALDGQSAGAPSAVRPQPVPAPATPAPSPPSSAQAAPGGLSPDDLIFINTSANIGKGSGITPRQAFLLSRVTSKMRIKEVCQVSGMKHDEVVKLVGKLIAQGIIHVETSARAGVARSAPKPLAPPQPVAQQQVNATEQPMMAVEGEIPLPSSAQPAMVIDGEIPPPPMPQPAMVIDGEIPPPPMPQPAMAVEGEIPPPPMPQTQPQPVQYQQPVSPPVQPARVRAAPVSPVRHTQAPARIVAPLRQRQAPKDYGKPDEKGTFADKMFGKILAGLLMEAESGVLRVTRPDTGGHKDIFLRQGFPGYVESHGLVEKECLGRLLRFAGKISDHDLERSIQEMANSDKRQGRILMEMGCITKKDLDVSLRWQVEIKIQDVFAWPIGNYEFYHLSSFDTELVSSKINMPALLNKGILRSMPINVIEGFVNKNAKFYPSKNSKQPLRIEDFNLKPMEFVFFEEGIDGSKSLEEVLRDIDFDRKVAMRLMVLFYATTLIYFGEGKAASSREAHMLQDLKDRALLTDKGTYFDALGIHWGSVTRRVEEGYEKVLKDYGKGSKLRKLGKDANEYCDKIVKKAEEAREFLVNEVNRKNYRLEIFDKSKLEISADLQLRQAETQILWKDDFRGAVENLESAAELNPKDGLIRAALGAAIVSLYYSKDRAKAEEGISIVKRALSMAPNNDMVHFYAGVAYRAANRLGQAKTEWQTTLQLNPNNKDARKALVAAGG